VKHSIRLVLALALGQVVVSGSVAQAQGFRLNAYRTPALPTDGLQLARPGTLEAKQWSAGANLDYANDPLVMELNGGDASSEYTSIVSSQMNGHVSLGYGLASRLSMYGMFNVVLLEQGQRTPMPNTAVRTRLADGPGLGDARLGARYRLAGGGVRDRAGLGFQAAVIVPLAELSDKGQNFRGESSVAGDFAMLGEVNLGVLRLGAAVGVRLRREVEFIGTKLGNELTLGGGIGIPLFGQKIEALAEAQVNTMLANAFGRSSTPAELLLGLRASPWQNWRFSVGAGPGLQRGVGSPDFRLLAGLAYLSTVKKEPETQSTDEMLELDRDSDSIGDLSDRCPADPEDADGFEDQDGCPELDNDNDGVPDATDRCTSEPEDRDGVEDDDGCLDSDNDHDGVDDSADKCPTEAEDKDGYDDADGCIDADNDGDGVLDANDRCPTVRGDAAHEGCSTSVSLDQGQIRILQRVEFALGRADLLGSSDPVLAAVQSLFETNPNLRKVMVKGHTDGRGDEKKNLELSKRRAATVVAWLAQHGVNTERVVAWGCGESQPIASDKDKAGQQMNRRVEFQVIDPEPTEKPAMEGCEAAAPQTP
jgi:large repetitive protein